MCCLPIDDTQTTFAMYAPKDPEHAWVFHQVFDSPRAALERYRAGGEADEWCRCRTCSASPWALSRTTGTGDNAHQSGLTLEAPSTARAASKD